jgi:hypothetical protein
MSGGEALRLYRSISKRLCQPVGRKEAIRKLDSELPNVWESQYAAMTTAPSELVIVTFGSRAEPDDHFISTMFDLAPTASGETTSQTDPRVVAVWGLSREEAASTRDKERMRGFLSTPKRLWSSAYKGRDRGHFFAHTMGGGLDINLFPQLSKVNQGGRWRELEKKAAAKPGTFCFIHPCYVDGGWIPRTLEYGLFDRNTFLFEGAVFGN